MASTTNKLFFSRGGGEELQAHLLTTKRRFEITYFSIARNTQNKSNEKKKKKGRPFSFFNGDGNLPPKKREKE